MNGSSSHFVQNVMSRDEIILYGPFQLGASTITSPDQPVRL
jgi:hypothetical protein